MIVRTGWVIFPRTLCDAVKLVCRAGFVLYTWLALNGCSGESDLKDINQFMQQVKAETRIGIQDIPATGLYQPYTYGASNLRSPFVPPLLVPDNINLGLRNTGVAPPKNHSRQFLERFNIVSLQMVGSMQHNGIIRGLIQDTSGRVHSVQTGDYMGMNWGKVEAISDARIDIIEIVSDGGDGWLRRPRSIELKSRPE